MAARKTTTNTGRTLDEELLGGGVVVTASGSSVEKGENQSSFLTAVGRVNKI